MQKERNAVGVAWLDEFIYKRKAFQMRLLLEGRRPVIIATSADPHYYSAISVEW